MNLIVIVANKEGTHAAMNAIPGLREATVTELTFAGLTFDYIHAPDLKTIDEIDRERRGRSYGAMGWRDEDRYDDRYDRDRRDSRRGRDDREERTVGVAMSEYQLLATKIHQLANAETVLIITDKFNIGVGDEQHIAPMFDGAMDKYVNSFRNNGVVMSTSKPLLKPVAAKSSSLNIQGQA